MFDEGIRKAKELVSGYIFDVLTKCCEELIQDALDNKSGFRNLTGNTITSYACGLFMDGRFSYFVCSGDSMKQLIYFYDAGYDRLHPSTKGQIRMARTLMYQLFALPATF